MLIDIVTLLTTGDNANIGLGFTIEDLMNGDPFLSNNNSPRLAASPVRPFVHATSHASLMGNAGRYSLPSKMSPLNPDSPTTSPTRGGARGGRGLGMGRGRGRGRGTGTGKPGVPPRT